MEGNTVRGKRSYSQNAPTARWKKVCPLSPAFGGHPQPLRGRFWMVRSGCLDRSGSTAIWHRRQKKAGSGMLPLAPCFATCFPPTQPALRWPKWLRFGLFSRFIQPRWRVDNQRQTWHNSLNDSFWGNLPGGLVWGFDAVFAVGTRMHL
jgi:hypothetical protein